MSGSTAELRILITSKDSASQAIKGLGQNLGGLGVAGKVATAALAGIAVAGGALAGVIGSSVGAAMDFESAMSAVGAVAGASSSELAALSQTALQLGQDTTLAGISASDAAKSMAALASGGISVADIMGGAARGALLLASAGGIDVAQAAEIAAAALNNFGLAGSQTGHVADLFAAAANSSAVTVTDLGESLKYIGPLASSMGLSIEEVTAALAEMGDQGIKGSQAGTSLRSILSSLAKPSKQASGLINELGLEFFDAGGKMKSLAGISEQLKTGLGGLTDQQRANALVTLFGNEALSAATVLYGEGADGLQKYLDQVNVAGSAAANGAKRNDNLKGSIEQLKSSVETAQIALGTAFIPALRGLTDAAAGAVNAAIPLIQAWGPRFVAMLTAGVTAVMSFGSNVASGIGAVIGAFRALFSGQINFSQFIGGMEVFVSTVAGKLGELATRAAPYLGAFFSAIGTFISTAAPQILAQMGIWASAFTDWITTTAIPFLAPRLAAFLTAIGTWVTGTALPAIGTFMLGLATAFSGWITTTAIPYLLTNLPLWLAALSTWITGTALPAIGTFVGQIGAAFGGWITGTAIPFLQTNLPLWLTALGTWITGTALPAVGTFLAGMGEKFGTWITEQAIPFLQTNLPLWLTAIETWISGTALPAVGTALVAVGTAFGDWVATKAVPWVQANLPGWLAAITSWITGTALPAIGTATQALGEAMGKWLTEQAIPFLQENMPVWGATIVHWIDTTKDSIQAGLEQLGEAMGKWVKEKAIPAVEADLPGWVAAITHAIDQANDAADTGTTKLGETMGKWVSRHATDLLNGDLVQYLSILTLTIASWPAALAVLTAHLAKSITDWAGAPAQAELTTNLGNLLNAISEWILRSTFLIPILAFKMGQGLMQGMLDGIEAHWPAVSGWLAGLPGRIADAVGDMAAALYQKGVDAVQGLINGILSQAGGVSAAIASITSLIPGGIGQLLGIKSPSRVLMAMGDDAMAGLILGMRGRGDDVGNTARDLGHALMGGIGVAIDAETADLQKKVADAASSVAKAITDTLGAMAALSSFDFAKNSPSGATLGWFQHLTTSLVATIVDAAAGFKTDALKAAGEFADAAGKVSAFIKNALDAFAALSSYDFAKGSPTGSALGWFRFLVTSLVQTIAEAARGFNTEALKAASDFSDAATKVTGFVKGALDAFAGLAKYAPPAVANIYAFGKTLRSLMNDFALVAEQVTQQAGDAAGKFATAIAPVVDVVGKALDSFTKLVGYVAPPAAAIYAFGKTLRAAINDFALVAEQVTQEAADAAGKFATAIGPVVDTVGKGVGSFLLLGTYTAPAASAIYEFGKTLRAVINDLALVAEQVTQEAADAAAKFAGSAASVVAIIGPAIEGLSKLADFVAPSRAAIDNLANAIFETVRRIAELASSMSQDGVKAAGEFGVAAGSVFGALKSALDVFTGMAKLVVPSRQAINEFAAGIAATVAQLGTIADQIGKDGIKKAADFGASVQSVFGSLKSSMDILTNLAKFKDEASKAFDSLQKGLQAAVDLAQGMVNQSKDLVLLSEEYAANMLKAATNFAKGQTVGGMGGEEIGKRLGEGVVHGAQTALDSHSPSQVMAAIGKDVVDGLVQGMSDAQQDAAKKAADVASAVAKAITDTLGAATALGKLDLATLPSGGQITGILAFTRALVAEMAASATILSEDGAKATSLFADTAGKVAEAMTKGLALLTGLRDYVAPAAGALYSVGKGLRDATADFAAIVDLLGTDVIQKATDFAANAGGIADAVGKGSDAFTKLASYVEPAAKAIYAMDKQLLAAVWDFAAMADLIPAEIVAKAALFADGAGKVVDVIGKGAAAFASLSGFAYTKAIEQGIYALGKAVMAATGDFAAIMDIFGPELVKKAATFADSAGRIVAVIGNGVAGFKALDGFTGVASASLAAFVRATGDLVKQIVVLSTGYAPALLAAASQYADTAGKALALLGSAANFKALDDFKRPADSSVGAFVSTVRDLVKRLVAVGQDFAEEGLKAANLFADAGGKAISMIGGAVSGFAGLATFVTPGRAAVDGLLATVRYIVARFGEMAQTMSTEGTKQLGDFGAATNAVLGGVKAAIDTFIALDKAVVPQTGDLSDLVVAVQGVTRNMATAAAALGDDAIKDATAFGTAASGIFTALKNGLDLFILIDKPGGWPTTDWLQPLIELMGGMLSRGGQLLTQSQELKAIADQFNANISQAAATFATGLGGGGLTLTGNVGGAGLIGGGGGGGTTTVNNYYISGNTLLSKDTSTQQAVTGIVTSTQNRTIGYATSG